MGDGTKQYKKCKVVADQEELDVLFKPVVELSESALESVEKLRTELQKNHNILRRKI